MLVRHLGFIFTITLFVVSINALAADTYRMNASYYVRNAPKFSGQDNVVGVLTKGSSFKVLKRKKLSNGAEALQIHVVGLTPTSKLQPSNEYWIYKPNNSDFIGIDRSATEAKGGAALCPECLKTSESTQSSQNNQSHLGDVSRTVIAQQNQISTGSLDDQIKKYSNSEKVSKTISHALRNKRSRSQGTCYRSVKKALLASKLIPHYYSDLAALNSKNTLKKFGFVNILDAEPYKSQISNNPNLAPKGAVLVYSSGIPCGGANGVTDCGHVEIKIDDAGKAGFVSDYYSPFAINQTPAARRYGSNYKLVGVLIKPED